MAGQAHDNHTLSQEALEQVTSIQTKNERAAPRGFVPESGTGPTTSKIDAELTVPTACVQGLIRDSRAGFRAPGFPNCNRATFHLERGPYATLLGGGVEKKHCPALAIPATRPRVPGKCVYRTAPGPGNRSRGQHRLGGPGVAGRARAARPDGRRHGRVGLGRHQDDCHDRLAGFPR